MASGSESPSEPLFPEIDSEPGTTEVESLCPQCQESGTTRLLLTKIPFYKEVILMSFSCEHCGSRNNEIQSGSKIQEQGIRITVKVKKKQDLNRQIVKSEFAGISIPEVSLEIPSGSQAGEITTIESVISRTGTALRDSQEDRKKFSPVDAEKVERFIVSLEELLHMNSDFTFILDDPSGNSFIESLLPEAIQVDEGKMIVHYHRSFEQRKLLGLVDDEEEEEEEDSSRAVWESRDAMKNEVMGIPSQCENCDADVMTRTKVTNIPYFKEVVVMATNCDNCGHRTNEVKSASGIGEKGIRMSLHVEKKEDLSRDVLKSEMCGVEVPDVDMKCGMGVLAGRFTTVEGLMVAVRDQLKESSMMFMGDSADPELKTKMESLFSRLDDMISGKQAFHLLLDDPSGNSYIQSFADSILDRNLKVAHYERTTEQNEELGLNDMRTEGEQCDQGKEDNA